MDKPKVSVVSISYNQEKYIRETLESFVTQQTDFNFEIIIADDCSTDKTAEIISEYASRYPGLFQPILRKKNLGVQPNLIKALQAAKGEYIALCEGDDYWTDTKKLQKQADFLDSNLSHAICFHPVRVFFERKEEKDYISPDMKEGASFTTAELLRRNFIPTNAVMYRRQKYNDLPENVMPLDWYLHLYHAYFGKIGFIDQTMGACRRHSGGVWWNAYANQDVLWEKHGLNWLILYVELLKLYGDNPKYRKIIIPHINSVITNLLTTDLKHGGNLINKAIIESPDHVADYIYEMYKENEVRVKNFQKHMDDQAAIITTLRRELAASEQNREVILHEFGEKAAKFDAIKGKYIWKTMRIPDKVRKKLKHDR